MISTSTEAPGWAASEGRGLWRFLGRDQSGVFIGPSDHPLIMREDCCSHRSRRGAVRIRRVSERQKSSVTSPGRLKNCVLSGTAKWMQGIGHSSWVLAGWPSMGVMLSPRGGLRFVTRPSDQKSRRLSTEHFPPSHSGIDSSKSHPRGFQTIRGHCSQEVSPKPRLNNGWPTGDENKLMFRGVRFDVLLPEILAEVVQMCRKREIKPDTQEIRAPHQ